MRVILVILLAGMVGTLVLPGLAQSDRASMVGVTKDASGAAIPNAKIKITHVATGQTFETESNAEGRYVTPNILKPGTYKVEASKEGFKTALVDQIVLNIGDVKEVNIPLELGAITQTVTVSEQTQQLETETSSRGEVITGRQITELPLKDRNFTSLALLAPGVNRAIVGPLFDQTALNQGDKRISGGDISGQTNEQGSTEASRFSRSGGASLSVNGLRPTTNNFSLDGVDNNEPQFGTIGVFPNPDAIAEFKVDTSVAKAEVGRGGATINTTYQSGTNGFHGSTFYYGQNDALNASHWGIGVLRNDEINNGVSPAQAEKDVPKSRIRVNEFGGTFGGPNIKNKTFFFVDFLGQRNATPNAFSTGVPTAKSRIGDFSEFVTTARVLTKDGGTCHLNSSGFMVCPTDVIDPLSCPTPGVMGGNGDTCKTFLQETGQNIIPNLQGRSDFSSQGFKLLALYPLPTLPTVANPNNSNHVNFFGVRNNTETINAGDVKIDHRFSDKNNIFGRYSQSNQARSRANFFPNVPTAGFGAGDEVGNTRQVAVSDTHVFKPTLLNEVRFGWTRVEIGIFNCGVGGACGVSPTTCQDLGIPNCNKGTLGTSGGILTGGFGTGEFEFTGDGGLFLVKSNNYYVNDNVTIITGKHTRKAGIEVRPRLLDTIDGGRAGGLKGNLQYGSGQPQSTGNVQGDYLLSRPVIHYSAGSILGGGNPFLLRGVEWAAFVQDDWKITPSLTLNLGLRWDFFPTMSEKSDREANYDVATRSIIRPNQQTLVDDPKRNFAPRVGFAYNFGPRKQYVLRGGYGIFYSTDGVDSPPLINNPPLTRSVDANNAGFFGGPNLNVNLTTGPPNTTPVDPPVISTDSKLFVVPRQGITPMIQESNLSLQWQLSRDWMIDVGYAATRARHLLSTRNLGNGGNGLGIARTPTGAATLTNPTPNSPIGTVIAYEDRSSSNYDGLQLRTDKRFSYGFQLTASYTFSHNIDDSTGVFTGYGESRGTNGGPVNPFDFHLERSNSSLDRRQVFITNGIWDLPIGKGKWIGGGISEGANRIIGGWQTNFILSAGSGQPFGVVADSNVGRGRVNVFLGCDPFKGVPAGAFLNVACFSVPTAVTADCPGGGTTIVGAVGPAGFVRNLSGKVDCLGNVGDPIIFGNSGRNQFTGPNYFRTDFSIFKNTNFGERYKVRFGLEFFNLFNTVDLLVPVNKLGDGNFNRFRTALPPRQIQYQLKIFF